MTGWRLSPIISPMVTPGDPKPPAVTFAGKLASQGKDRDRWTLNIPRHVSRLLPKDCTYEVTLRLLGSITQ